MNAGLEGSKYVSMAQGVASNISLTLLGQRGAGGTVARRGPRFRGLHSSTFRST